MARILIVDDEKSIRRTLGEFLRDAGYEVVEAEDADAALEKLRAAAFDVVVTDIILPRVSGVELLRLIQGTAPDVQVVMMTGEPTVETAAEALRLGAADYLFKPIDKAAILRAAGNAARIKDLEDTRRRLEAENQAHREHLERLVAQRTAQLQASEARYRSLVETAFDWVWEVDAQGRYTYASPRVVDLLGYRPEDILGHTPFEFMPDDEARRVQAIFAEITAQREPFAMLENTNWHRDGRLVILETSGTPIRSPAGEFLGYRGMDRDITQRKQAEAAVRESERKLRTLFEGSRDAIMTEDPVIHRFTSCNPAAVRMFGAASEADLITCGPANLSPERQPDGRLSSEAVQARDAAVMEQGVQIFEWRHRRLNGEEFAADVLLARIDWDNRPVVMATVRDITDRKQAEMERLRLATAVEQAAEGVFITDTDGVILYANPAFERITGYTRQEALGQTPRILKSGKHDEAFYQQLWATLARGEVWQGHFINQRKDGSLFEEDATISPVRDAAGKIVHYVAVTRDVTAQVALEAQLRQAQKMEALGTLASGVAHEINNPLFGIRGYAELIADSLPPENELVESAAAIIRQTDHVGVLVRNLLTFARQDKQESRLVAPNDIIQSVLSLLRTVVRHDHITLRVDVPEGLPPVACRGQQLEQVLMNLLTNARDALNEKFAGHSDGKLICLRAGLIDKDGAPWLRMTVEDHGAGIPAPVRERIFDPFYTTKPAGKGTGLGLAISHGIVKDHGGELHFETEPGRGTRFHVDLPVTGG